MSVLESCCVALTVYAAILIWQIVNVVTVQVETSRFLLERARAKAQPPRRPVGVGL